MSLKKVLCVVGARPNFMKIAPIMRAFLKRKLLIETRLVHTGQHYDYAMNESFFNQLGIPSPDISLNVGSGSHAEQTAEIMKRFEGVLGAEGPECVLVVGDVNSTIACALVAAKAGVRVVHVEAGLRSRDRKMPEEINRVLTDQLADRLYVTERDAIANLLAEGVSEDRIVFVGNVMIDTLINSIDRAVAPNDVVGDHRKIISTADGYAVLTLHRPSNVDDLSVLSRLLGVLTELAEQMPLVFPVHPRTEAKIKEGKLGAFFDNPRVITLPPLGYLEMIGLMREARLILTDSGGLQEEATALGVPCLTLRENTERPITLTEGTNTLVGSDAETIRRAFDEVVLDGGKRGRQPELWDGMAAERIVSDLAAWLEEPAQ